MRGKRDTKFGQIGSYFRSATAMTPPPSLSLLPLLHLSYFSYSEFYSSSSLAPLFSFLLFSCGLFANKKN